jgi:hypothetical protein
MDRMFVEAAPAVTTSPENHSTGDRFPVEMLCIASGTRAPRCFGSPLPRRPAGAAAANPCNGEGHAGS